jgi:tricorn protease
LWSVPINGGSARSLTQHRGNDRRARFSTDGKQIAFTSDRGQGTQAFVMPSGGGAPKQLTHHSAGSQVEDWYPDGKGLVVSGKRDHYWRHPERMFRIDCEERQGEQLLFDDYAADAALSPDGKQLLFTREGPAWWRKGYYGSQAAQIWLVDLATREFTRLVAHDRGALWPMWHPDGKAFYYVDGQSGSFNLWHYDLASKESRQLTKFDDDSVVFPCISRDGSQIVFRHLFDFYRLRPDSAEPPQKIEITYDGDAVAEPVERVTLAQATQVSFSRDGLEIAFIAGGDLWVMDTELREPRQVTATPEEERDPAFAPDGQSILYVSDADDGPDIWRAERADARQFWWRNDTFELSRLTSDTSTESDLAFSPDGKLVAFVKGRGELWTMKPDGLGAKRVIAGWDHPEFAWSPDGKWFVYAMRDDNHNRDIWIAKADGKGKPYNLSRHPDNDDSPVWSPDGKLIAFTGRRQATETDIYYVWLQEVDEEASSRDRTLRKAIEKEVKARQKPTTTASTSSTAKPASDAKVASTTKSKGSKTPKPAEVKIDFDQLHERIHRISISDTAESNLVWAPDSKKLAFSATINGARGTYTVEVPDSPKPKQLSAQTGTQARWLAAGNQIVWLADGLPASLSSSGTKTSFRFSAPQTVDRAAHRRAAFEQCWRLLRDNYYDDRLGNRNWTTIRAKYADMAAAAGDDETLATVINLMNGELNGSHLGFSIQSPDAASTTSASGKAWREETVHLGLRFDPDYDGPGLKVRDVIPESPADKRASKITAGEVVMSIDGQAVDPTFDLTRVLNGPANRDMRLVVRSHKEDSGEKERTVTLRPTSYAAINELLYEKWVRDNRRAVSEASGGKLAYLHIRGMNDVSFYRLEEELASVAGGCDGLVIDVRENGGGSTTDHLLTVLMHPEHAIAVPRDGGPGYPQDRIVYATWNKPISVLCNQNSFSNAESFSHAVKTLKRGQLVGVPTAGGVITVGTVRIMNVGYLRLPTRGWYVVGTGEDMELNGAKPDHLLWPEPEQLPHGKDVQLAKAIEVLKADVAQWQKRDRPKLHKASEREEFKK